MTDIYLGYDRYTYTTRKPDSGDGWDRGDTSSDITFDGLFLDKPNSYYYESIKASSEFSAGDIGYGVVVIYDTGDSFGYDSGYSVEFLDVFNTYAEAEALEKSIYDGSYSGYKPWEGYFERLSSVEIVSGVVL